MATYRLPVFNLTCNIWRNGNPVTNPPDVTTSCNLAGGERTGTLLVNTASSGNAFGGMWLLLPPRTDIRDGKAIAGADIVEVPALTGRFYDVYWVDDLGSGFQNEHRFAEIVARVPWPVPFPGGGGGPPPPTGSLPFYQCGTFPSISISVGFNPTGSAVMAMLFCPTNGGLPPRCQSLQFGNLAASFITGGNIIRGLNTDQTYWFLYTPTLPFESLTFLMPNDLAGAVLVREVQSVNVDLANGFAFSGVPSWSSFTGVQAGGLDDGLFSVVSVDGDNAWADISIASGGLLSNGIIGPGPWSPFTDQYGQVWCWDPFAASNIISTTAFSASDFSALNRDWSGGYVTVM